MKKQIKILLIIAPLLFFSGQHVRAQMYNNSYKSVWSLGPELGLNISNYGHDVSGNSNKAGFIGGASLTYSVENTHAFTAKLLYAQKGANINGVKQALNYIELPLMGRFFFNREGKCRPNVFLGPSFSFLANATNKIGENNPAAIPNFRDHYRSFDFGATGGLGLNFLIARETRLILDGRYTYGFADVTKASGYVNNKALSLTAGVTFGL